MNSSGPRLHAMNLFPFLLKVRNGGDSAYFAGGLIDVMSYDGCQVELKFIM